MGRDLEKKDWLVSLFNGIITFVDHLIPKPFFKKNYNGTI